MVYFVEYFNRARKTWLSKTLAGRNFVETESEIQALQLFFEEVIGKKGDFRIRSIVVFPDGGRDCKTICELRK